MLADAELDYCDGLTCRDYRAEMGAESGPDAFGFCIHCERAYPWRWHKHDIDLILCPYDDCDGSILLDRLPWRIVQEANPTYPAAPELGKHYPMYGQSG